jgi:hypothetical protein
MATGNLSVKDDLDQQLNNAKNQHKKMTTDIEQYIVNNENDLPQFGNIVVYDYDKDIETFKKSSKELIKSMAELYLKDRPDMLEDSYIEKKIDEDSKYYGQTQLLQKMSEKLLLQQLRQIDQGDNTPKMYEVANQTMNQIRENIKDGRNARLEIEKQYKELRKDFGMTDVVSKTTDTKTDNTESEDAGLMIDTAQLNDMIEKLQKQKK